MICCSFHSVLVTGHVFCVIIQTEESYSFVVRHESLLLLCHRPRGLHFFLALAAEATTVTLESHWLHFLPLFFLFLLSHLLPSTLTFVSVQQREPFIPGGLVAPLGFSASGYSRTLLMVTTAPPPLPWIPDSRVLSPTLFLPHFLGRDSSCVIPKPRAPVALPNCSPAMGEAPSPHDGGGILQAVQKKW